MHMATIIPVFIENRQQINFLERALKSIEKQSLHPRRVIISDNTNHPSFVSEIKNLLQKTPLNILYLANTDSRGCANNTNFGVNQVTEDLIHILHQDDYIVSLELYEEVFSTFLSKSNSWIIAQAKNEDVLYSGKFKTNTKFGFNDIGNPSCLFIPKKLYIPFNSNYRMLLDVINFHEYATRFGNPIIINGFNIQMTRHKQQLSQNISSKEIVTELMRFIVEYKITDDEIQHGLLSYERNFRHQLLFLRACRSIKRISFLFFVEMILWSFLKTYFQYSVNRQEIKSLK